MDFFRRLFGLTEARVEEASERIEPEPPQAPQPIPPSQTRPLAPPEEYISVTKRIRMGHMSDPGLMRSNNQDTLLIFATSMEGDKMPPPFGLFIVADGMGGHHDGERASRVAAQAVARHVIREIYIPFLEENQPDSDQKTISEVLTEAMEAANAAVNAEVPEGGTTVTCVIVRGDLAYFAHVGDSRAYLITDGQQNMELITRDHSLVQRLIELDQLTPEEAAVHPQRNVLYRAIGQGDTLEVDAATRRLPPSARLLLCSDGLWGVVGDENMLQILRENADPQEACERLIQAANEKGGPDNITVVLVQMPR
jgi:serine/threonine protein phosphatase PrpC